MSRGFFKEAPEGFAIVYLILKVFLSKLAEGDVSVPVVISIRHGGVLIDMEVIKAGTLISQETV